MTPSQPYKHLRKPETQYTWYWIIWAVLSGGSFAALEAKAVASGEIGNTLSVHWRRLFGIYPERPWSPVTKMLICGLLQWLIIHIIVEGKEERNTRIAKAVHEEVERVLE